MKISSFDSIQCVVLECVLDEDLLIVLECVLDKDLLLENLNMIVICHMTHS